MKALWEVLHRDQLVFKSWHLLGLFVQPYPFSSHNDTFISHETKGNLYHKGSVITLALSNNLTQKSDTLMDLELKASERQQ